MFILTIDAIKASEFFDGINLRLERSIVEISNIEMFNTIIPISQMVYYYINKKQRLISTTNIERQIIILCRVICQIQKAVLP